MTALQFTTEQLENEFAIEMSKIAKQNVTARLYDNEDIFLFGSELACLRIANSYKHKETKVSYSENLKTYYVTIYKFL
jgi:tRNA(Leu) C34 or U34 (ribose-2'-O)-methylase TrmL